LSGGPPRAGLPPLPPGFAWEGDARAAAAAAAPLLPALRALGLLRPDTIESHLAAATGARGRAATAVVALGDAEREIVVRGLRRGGVLGPLLGGALLGPARPFRELAANAALRAAGAPVPEPVFAMAWRRGATWRAAVATRLEAGAVDALDFLERAPHATRLRRALRAAGRALRRFHDAGGSHADLHVKNLLVREGAGACDVVVIDLDRARVVPALGAAARAAELARLERSLRKRGLVAATCGARGSALFFHAYVEGDRSLRRALLAHLGAARRRAALHALHYRRATADRE
jgi:tRNA A-37 threonylcarbamoyl transferase component Bud32